MSASLQERASFREASPPMEVVAGFLDVAPVNLEAMTRALGIDLDMHADMSDDVSGSIRRRGDRYFIEVNGQDSPVRRRFTLAHELGHFLLHRWMMNGGITDDRMYRSRLNSPYERQANQIAAQLLMPPGLVHTAWAAGARDVGQLARAFGVSEQAMSIRLRELGLSL